MNTEYLIRLARQFSQHKSPTIATVSTYACNDGKVLGRLQAGAGITIRRTDLEAVGAVASQAATIRSTTPACRDSGAVPGAVLLIFGHTVTMLARYLRNIRSTISEF